MKRARHQTPHDGRDRSPTDAIEAYLLVHAHHQQAHREAENLCARMPWLTTAQAEDLTRHYLRQRIDLTRRMLLTTTERATQLRQEYETRYALLRRSLLKRHAACASAVLACVGGITTLACLLTR
ncbi:hypothetical protein ACFU53_13725 [Streptomyces sp. NPDC057474]|uniref:hypothetical protein n=1 Tax=Streptomyces sp. NPDC057474 TaxID=3346144 RepID=UPI0036C20D42